MELEFQPRLMIKVFLKISSPSKGIIVIGH